MSASDRAISGGLSPVFANRLKVAASPARQDGPIATRLGRCAVPSLSSLTRIPSSPAGNIVLRFWRHESGATAIEYGLVSTFVGMAVIGAFRVYGGVLADYLPRIFDLFTFK
ncbi:Flp family type IVb pilin [Methylorubrum populi]|uniref:Flp family type IVb pilin n=1 Tax=Methylorubrum populi TaxID=223967 RepID=UPI003F65B94D